MMASSEYSTIEAKRNSLSEVSPSFCGRLPAIFNIGRDVPRDGGGADDPALLVLDRRDAHGHVDDLSVFSPTHGLIVADALSLLNAFQDFRHLIGIVRRRQNGDRLADGLPGGEPIDLLRAAVPGRDDPLGGLGDDGVVGRLHDGRQKEGPVFNKLFGKVRFLFGVQFGCPPALAIIGHRQPHRPFAACPSSPQTSISLPLASASSPSRRPHTFGPRPRIATHFPETRVPYGLPVVGSKILQPYLLEYYRGIEGWSVRKFLNLHPQILAISPA